jgi:hypothetical protein
VKSQYGALIDESTACNACSTSSVNAACAVKNAFEP